MADGKTLKEAAAEKLGHVITVQGISIEGVTADTLNDFDFLEALAVMGDPDSTDMDIIRSLSAIGPVVFGSKQWKRVKAELREQNDGKLTGECVIAFVNDTMAALKAKNS